MIEENQKNIKYIFENGEILMYDKKTKKLYNAYVEKENETNEKFRGISIYNLDKFFKNKFLVLVMDKVISYITYPLTFFVIYVNFSKFQYLHNDVQELINRPILLVTIGILVFLISLLLHEFGHIVMAISKGANVPEVGIGLKNRKFLAYTKIIQLNKIKRKCDKVLVHIAGINVNIIIMDIALIIYSISDNIYFLFVAILDFTIALFNFSIYYESDGADILKCLLEKRNNKRKKEGLNKVVIVSAIIFNVVLPLVCIVGSLVKK